MPLNRLRALLLCSSGLVLAACAMPIEQPSVDPDASFRVVALGDSYGSGGGSPDERFKWWKFCSTPKWDDKRCNRSANAATRLAVEQLRESTGSSIDYVSYACSGSKIRRGLLEEYDGSEPPKGDHEMLPPQVDALHQLDSESGVDAVTITIGGNDVYFEYVAATCAIVSHCEFTESIIEERLEVLRGELDALAESLAEVEIESDRILLLEYPDPTHDSAGAYCDASPPGDVLAGISEDEARWVSEWVLPSLNRELCVAAERHGWTYVSNIADSFGSHGYCAQPQNWLNTMSDSLRRQRHYRGALHPNPSGYAAIGGPVAIALTPLVGGSPPPADGSPVPVSTCPAAPDSPF